MASQQNFRLTADNYSEKNLERALRENHGLLGAYEIREYEDLQAVMSEDFTIEWRPAQMDPNAGLLKLRPQTNDGKRRLDRARARPVLDRHPWLGMYHAVGFIQVTKRNREAKSPIIQDFLIRHYDNEALHAYIEQEDLDSFHEHINTKMRDDFNRKQIETIFNLLPRVQNVMYREPPQRSKKEEESSTSETTASTEADDTSGNDDGNETEVSTATENEVDSADDSDDAEDGTMTARGESTTFTHVDEVPYYAGDESERVRNDSDEQPSMASTAEAMGPVQ